MTRLQNSDGVVALVQATDKTRKAQLLIAAAEVYASAPAHTFSDKKIFAELFRNLVVDAPAASRRRVALLLAHCDSTPEDVLITLARDSDPNVAYPVLCHAGGLCERELIAAVGRGPDCLRQAIAARSELSPNLLAALEYYSSKKPAVKAAYGYEKKDDLRSRAANDSISSQRAQEQASGGHPLTLDVFLGYDSVQRLHALATAEAKSLARKSMQQSGFLERLTSNPLSEQDAQRMERTALSGDRFAFSEILAYQTGLQKRAAFAIVTDTGGEALLVCLKHLGLPAEKVNTILVRLWTAAKTLKSLRILSDIYERMTPGTAAGLMHEWRGEQSNSRHQPLHEEMERPVSLRSREVAGRSADKTLGSSNHTISVTRVTR